MLQEKLDKLIDLGNELIQQGRVEEGARLLKFCEDPTRPGFLAYCAKNGIEDMFEPLAKAGFDISKNYGRTDLRRDKITLASIAKIYGHEELSNKIRKLALKQIMLSKQLLYRAKEGMIESKKRTRPSGIIEEDKGVKQLIDEGAVIDWCLKDRATPLMLACQYGHVEVVKMLIEAGADVNATDCLGATPLMWASYSNNIEIIKLLIKAGVDVNIRDTHNGSTAIMWWATNSYDNVEAIDLLVNNHAKVFQAIDVELAIKNKVLDKDRTALDFARSKANYKIVKYLDDYRIRKLRNIELPTEESSTNKPSLVIPQ